MPSRIIAEWRAQRRLRRGVRQYVESLCAEPDESDVRWLAATATKGDEDRARWELRYARRALGLLVAERDALDDRTASAVAALLAQTLESDRNVAAGRVAIAKRQLNSRLGTYRGVLHARTSSEPTSVRLGRSLLHSAGGVGSSSSMSAAVQAGDILARYLEYGNEALRRSFGEASFPAGFPTAEPGGE